jgi:leucyl-tRNA synthetase
MGGSKMSKSKGNLIAPEMYFDTVGADSLRLFHLFLGPPADDSDWTEQSDELIDGCARFLDRLYRLAMLEEVNFHDTFDAEDLAVVRSVHRTIVRVTEGLDRWSYNTSVAALMELLNTTSKWARSEGGAHQATLDDAVDTMLKLLAPMAPHMPAELWEIRHGVSSSLHAQSWPVADEAMLVNETVVMAVQINGKVRARLDVDPEISEDDAARAAQDSPEIQRALEGATVQRVIARPPRLVNIIS